MFTTRIWVQLGLVLVALLVFSSRSSAQTISCSSDDGHRHYCAADTRDGVSLVNQKSESPCRQGYSWGSDGRGIWVDHGCRAEFATGGGHGHGYHQGNGNYNHDGNGNYNREGNGDYNRGPYQSEVISCSSDDMHRHYCPADTRGGVRLLKQRSDSSCRQGYSWGFDRRGIWVDHGCRADFQVVR